MKQQVCIAFAAATVFAARLAAHDFWLAAEHWSPAPGTPVTITAGIGERFPTRTSFRSRDNWLADWRLIGGAGEATAKPNLQKKDLVLAADVTLPSPGVYLGVAVVSAQTTEMQGPEFTDYLKEEGLERIIEARRAGESLKAEFVPATAVAAVTAGEGGLLKATWVTLSFHTPSH